MFIEDCFIPGAREHKTFCLIGITRLRWTLTFPLIPMNNRNSDTLQNLANVSVSLAESSFETKLEITGLYHLFCFVLLRPSLACGTEQMLNK